MKRKKLIVVLMVLQFIDVMMTILFVNTGTAAEGNPIAGWFINGFGLVPGLLLKFTIMTGILLSFVYHASKIESLEETGKLSHKIVRKISAGVPIVLIVQALVVVWNIPFVIEAVRALI